jgi:hypothetical protein
MARTALRFVRTDPYDDKLRLQEDVKSILAAFVESTYDPHTDIITPEIISPDLEESLKGAAAGAGGGYIADRLRESLQTVNGDHADRFALLYMVGIFVFHDLVHQDNELEEVSTASQGSSCQYNDLNIDEVRYKLSHDSRVPDECPMDPVQQEISGEHALQVAVIRLQTRGGADYLSGKTLKKSKLLCAKRERAPPDDEEDSKKQMLKNRKKKKKAATDLYQILQRAPLDLSCAEFDWLRHAMSVQEELPEQAA